MMIGRVLSSEVTENKNGELPVLMLEVELSDADDIQHVEWFRQPGDDAGIPPNTSVLVDDLGSAWKVGFAADDGVLPGCEAGEREIYSWANGKRIANVKCKADGTVEAGLEAQDFVAMAAKVDTFISDIVTLLTTWSVIPQDGGTALQTAAKALWLTPPESVASLNLKAEG